MMIKEDNDKLKRPLFHPTFGSRPGQIIGRDEILSDFLEGLDTPVGSKERCSFFIGQRGMGKTSMLLEIADRAEEQGFVVARVTAYEDMCQEIIEELQRKGEKYINYDNRNVTGVNAGAFGFSFGLNFSEATERQLGFRGKLTLLMEKFEEAGKGVLILVDEARTSKAMRELAVTYQHLVGDGRNIAIAMAGLPQAVSGVLNDDILTFLNRANKIELGAIDVMEIQLFLMSSLKRLKISCKQSVINRAARETKGFPYLMQLIGYYIVRISEDGGELTDGRLSIALQYAKDDLKENVFSPILRPLSEKDKAFLNAMARAGETCRVADVADLLKWKNSMVQPYRARLLEYGIIESPRKGELEFAVPFLREYLVGGDG